MARLAGLELARPVGRLGPIAVHRRQPVARIGLAQAAVDTPTAAEMCTAPEVLLGGALQRPFIRAL